MSWRRRTLESANLALNRLGVHVLPVHEYLEMQTNYEGPVWKTPTLPEEARRYLTLSNPRLSEMQRKYEGHPAAAHTQWAERNVLKQLAPTDFRGEKHYVYQMRYSPSPQVYYVSAYYTRDHDECDLFRRLIEDGTFGAYTLPFEDGTVISRDFLESINEINFIHRVVSPESRGRIRLLDVGAGYGRLVHRLTEAFSESEIFCTDAVSLSTFISEYYLRFRRVDDRAHVVTLDEVESRLSGAEFDIVTNIHSFSECGRSVIAWWLGAIDRINVQKMMIIPNARDDLLSTEADGRHLDFSDLLAKFGWRLIHKEPIYAQSVVASKYALYPNFCFHLFEHI